MSTLNRPGPPALPTQSPAPSAFALMPRNFDEAWRLAQSIARCAVVPLHFRGKPDDCLVIIEQAIRWEMSPYAVIQCASMIHGRPMYEGKLVAAVVNARGPKFGLSGRLRYHYEGEDDKRRIFVSGTLEGKEETIDVWLSDARTSNEHWTRQPDQQLAYYGARVWARRFMPELMLGVYSPEEMPDREDRPQQEAFSGTTIDGDTTETGTPETATGSTTVNETETAKALGDDIPALEPQPKPRMKQGEWLTALEAELEDAQTGAERNAILGRPQVKQAMELFRNGAYDRLIAIISAAHQRTATEAPEVG